jgi:mannose-6-phosphate isomerase-like protein (cupin superfamily)
VSIAVDAVGEMALAFAGRPGEWVHRVRLRTGERWYERLRRDDDHEIWLISWLPGQATGFHDHGGSRGAFAVALGRLEEHEVGRVRTLVSGELREFGRGHIHDVRNISDAPAVSVHVYSPPLSVMNRYDLVGDDLVVLPPERAEDWTQ